MSVARLFAASCTVTRERAECGTEAKKVQLKGSEVSGFLSENWLNPQPLMSIMLSASCSPGLVCHHA